MMMCIDCQQINKISPTIESIERYQIFILIREIENLRTVKIFESKNILRTHKGIGHVKAGRNKLTKKLVKCS